MQQWLNARCAQLLQEINNTPYTDDCDDVKLKLIRNCMREVSVEMFHRAAENSRKEIEKLHNRASQEAVEEVKSKMSAEVNEVPENEGEEKPEPKIKLSSSVIRRVDSF